MTSSTTADVVSTTTGVAVPQRTGDPLVELAPNAAPSSGTAMKPAWIAPKKATM